MNAPLPPASPPAGRGLPLTVKLLLLFGGTLLLLEIPALLVLLPRSRAQFERQTEDLILASQEGMRDIAEELIRTNEEVVVDLASHISETYGRELADLPLTLARGDESRSKSMILEEVHQLRGRTLQNVEFLGEELRLRSEEDVDERMEALRKAQREEGDRFAGSLQRQSIAFSVFLILAPLPVLLIGLYRMILRPMAQLADATARARSGDLSFTIESTSRDEIGQLKDSFNRMIQELDRSRGEIEAWNARLEHRVEEKTGELRDSLARQRETTRRLEATLTELRDTQGRLIQAEKMASLGSLARSVAHEFNNLLGGILGSAEAALEEGPPASSAEAFDVIRRAARRACVVTDNLLRFSRRREAVMRPTDPARVLDECLTLMEPEFRKRAIRVERAFGDLPVITADAGQLHQVFLNLLTNAAHAVGREGVVRVEGRAADGGVEIRVEDSGPGVPEGIRDRIFEPFFTTRDPGEGGTGLGLAVSYGIVTAHGGTIELADRPGDGARFVVRLPGKESEGRHGE